MFQNLGRARKERVFRPRNDPLEEMEDEEIRRRYRFNKANVRFILGLIRQEIEPVSKRSKAISAELQVIIVNKSVKKKIPLFPFVLQIYGFYFSEISCHPFHVTLT